MSEAAASFRLPPRPVPAGGRSVEALFARYGPAYRWMVTFTRQRGADAFAQVASGLASGCPPPFWAWICVTKDQVARSHGTAPEDSATR